MSLFRNIWSRISHTATAFSVLPCFFLALAMTAVTSNAHAYIGPGIGIGTLSAILGLIATFFVAIFAILYYPIKRVLRRCKKSQEPTGSESEQ